MLVFFFFLLRGFSANLEMFYCQESPTRDISLNISSFQFVVRKSHFLILSIFRCMYFIQLFYFLFLYPHACFVELVEFQCLASKMVVYVVRSSRRLSFIRFRHSPRFSDSLS